PASTSIEPPLPAPPGRLRECGRRDERRATGSAAADTGAGSPARRAPTAASLAPAGGRGQSASQEPALPATTARGDAAEVVPCCEVARKTGSYSTSELRNASCRSRPCRRPLRRHRCGPAQRTGHWQAMLGPEPCASSGGMMDGTVLRPIDRLFASYSDDHRNVLNQRIHVVAVPAILWSVVALLWCIPVFGTIAKTGIWAALAMFFAWMFYYRMSRPLGMGMLAAFFFCGCLCRLLEMR